MNSAVQSDTFIGNFVAAFLQAQGKKVPRLSQGEQPQVMDLKGELNLAQVKGLYRAGTSYSHLDLADHQVEHVFKLADMNSSEGLSFGQFVTMHFVPLYLSVQSQAFPTPEAVPVERNIASSGLERLTPELQADVEQVLNTYAASLRRTVQQHGDVEI
eukprot:6266244-Amphidinium_carterae.1